MAGVGGGYLSLVRVPQWTEGMTAGAGWIALALVVFSGWRPFPLLIGAYIFGGITILQLNLQAIGVNINIALLSMAPYLATILALVVISMSRFRGNRGAPGCLGRSFVKTT
jgi:simple sugar transport system permease protein